MCIKTDFHLHSSLSADSDTPMEEMIQRGLALGLRTMCFTEHMDYNIINEGLSFMVDTDIYHKKYLELREKYKARIELLFGIELGIEPQNKEFLENYVKSWDFDFVIGSSHIIDGFDPYYPAYFEGRTEEESYRRYFETITENLSAFSDVDTYGHLDYIVRYGPDKDKYYSYEKYRDLIDPALKMMIEKDVGLEVNSAGLKKGLAFPNPHPDIIRAYRRMGGEIITVGSDAHCPENIAYDFETVRSLLLECGFQYYTIFRGRKPEFVKL
ncbi:MAG: histidinol-phosphatase HisJ family protein [Eubacteriales bacterium]|nr:histidinol-phosphatase HisJ family protein [Eubacteriales bacterium]